MRVILLLAAVALLAGCSFPIGDWRDAVEVQKKETQEGFKDVLAISSIDTIPHSPVVPDIGVSLSFVVENRDKDKKAADVEVNLFDPAVFRLAQGAAPVQQLGTILQGDQRLVRYELVAPSKAAISGLETDVDLNFKVNYKFTGSSLFHFSIINVDEIKTLQRAGQKAKVPNELVQGSGPVQVKIALDGQDFILNGYRTAIKVTVANRGDVSKGGLVNNEIPKEGLHLTFPGYISEVTAPDSGSTANGVTCASNPDWFFCCEGHGDPINDPDNAFTTCHNQKPIPLYKGESQPLVFTTLNSNIGSTPYRSFRINAEVDYTYELRDSKNIKIKPVAGNP